MRFCSFMNEPNISVRGREFSAVWQELVDYEERLRWPEECYRCEIRAVCRMCAGSICARSGSISKVDRAFCNKLKCFMKDKKEDD